MGHTDSVATGKVLRRLKILEGQIRGLQDMIEKDTYCVCHHADIRREAGAFKHREYDIGKSSFDVRGEANTGRGFEKGRR